MNFVQDHTNTFPQKWHNRFIKRFIYI